MKWNDLYSGRKDRKLSLLDILGDLIRKRRLSTLLGKAYKLWKRSGWAGVYQRLALLGHSYKQWVRLFDVLDNDDREMILDHIAKLQHKPLISILMPIGDLSERWLKETIDSVRAQLYPNWELCIAYDATSSANTHAVLAEYTNLDARVRGVCRERNGHVSAAFNSALGIARGEFVVFLNCYDVLSQHALYMVAHAVNEKPQVGLMYSDEDKIDEKGSRFDPYFKPDWDADLFVAQNVATNLSVCRTSIVRDVGGFRDGYGVLDLILRVSDRIPVAHIHHLPYVLYHRRIILGQLAIDNGEISMATISAYIARSGRSAKAIPVRDGCFRIKEQMPVPTPLVSIIIPTYNGFNLLRRCIGSIKEKTSYPNYELIVVDNCSDDNETLEYLDFLKQNGVAQIIKYSFPFNYSAINNFAARDVKGEFICLMNNDIEVISEDWLEEMVSQAARPDIGAVGAMLYYPDDTIQHAGVLVGMGGVAGHLYAGSLRGIPGYKCRARLAQTLSAVTAACLVVKTRIYWEVGGLDEKNLAVAFNDVDFCLRVREIGYRNFWTPFAEFYHHESASRGLDDRGEKLQRFQGEITYMHSRWEQILGNDPAYNPNLSLDYSYPFPAVPPRGRKTLAKIIRRY